MSMTAIKRPSLGEAADLGDLYDAHTDTFTGMNIFKNTIPSGALSSKDSDFVDVQYVHSDKLSDKFSKLGISGELQTSFLVGLVTPSGSANYLKETKSLERNASISLIYSVNTKEEKLKIYNEELKSCFALEGLQSGTGTHFVVGIKWGANLVISAEYQNTDNKKTSEIDGMLAASFDKLALKIEGKVGLDYNTNEKSVLDKVNIRIYGDILPRDGELPVTIEEALNLAKQAPILIQSSNDGKGKPLVYMLLPVSRLQEYLEHSMKVEKVIQAISNRVLSDTVKMFEDIIEGKQLIQQYLDDMNKYRVCLHQPDFDEVSEKLRQLQVHEGELRSKLLEVLPLVRAGQRETSEIEDVKRSHDKSEHSLHMIRTTIESWSSISKKIELAKIVELLGAKYVGEHESFENIKTEFYDSTICAIFIQAAESTALNENQELFMACCKSNDPVYVCVVVDCHHHPELWPGKVVIRLFEKRRAIDNDLLQTRLELAGRSWARNSGKVIRIITKPNKRGPLILRCSGKNCDHNELHYWLCSDCKTALDYGFNYSCYCNCGVGDATKLEFKCLDVDHGDKFEPSDRQFLIDQLDRLRPFDELNIAVLGETGVGKSTWINAFYNYLAFDTLDAARDHGQENGCLSLIPTNFVVTDENFEETKVSTGESDNECAKTGQSATQMPKVYTFRLGNTIVRIVDTPGIGDVRGIEQDKKNFENVLNTLSNYDELHGICILLKPNNSRVTVAFQFCVLELLTHLHKGACQNVVFCFTNSRGSFYRPGDTLPVLKKLLVDYNVDITPSQHTVYCFDSESYRFLAAVCNKNPVKFTEEQHADFCRSWETSVRETNRLLSHIREQPPHAVKETTTLNSARRKIEQLSEPMAAQSRLLEMTKKAVKREQEEIQNIRLHMKDLETKKYTKRPTIEITDLPKPQTVCGHHDCMSVVDDHVAYPQICHENCKLGGIPRNVVGHHDLTRCWALFPTDGTKCRHASCQHPYQNHVHIYYKTRIVDKDCEDESVLKALQNAKNSEDAKNIIIGSKQKELNELDEEIEKIQKASVKFACFLKVNAITPYNDAALKYLEHMIVEEGRLAYSGRESVLEELKALKNRYTMQKRILEDQMAKADSTVKVLNPDQVKLEVEVLYKLKHSGPAIKAAMTKMSAMPVPSGEVFAPVVPGYTISNLRGANVKGQLNRNILQRGFDKMTSYIWYPKPLPESGEDI